MKTHEDKLYDAEIDAIEAIRHLSERFERLGDDEPLWVHETDRVELRTAYAVLDAMFKRVYQ